MGILGHVKESVTIVNRTKGAGKYERDLSIRYDGEDIVIAPGELHGFPKVAVPYAIKQNPIMGTKHPLDPRMFHSLIGVVGSKSYPADYLTEEQLDIANGKLEVVDRDGSVWGEPMEKRQLLRKAKQYTSYEAQAAIPADFDVNKNID